MPVIDDHLAKLPVAERVALERIRRIVQATVPEAQETISYGMPAFKYKDSYLMAFAAFKQHLSIFPGAAAVEALSSKLSGYKQSKGTIQFTLDHPIPEPLLKEIILHRLKAI